MREAADLLVGAMELAAEQQRELTAKGAGKTLDKYMELRQRYLNLVAAGDK